MTKNQMTFLSVCAIGIVMCPVAASSVTPSPNDIARPFWDHRAVNTVESGKLLDWPDSGSDFVFDDHSSATSGIEAWWALVSIATQSGKFYPIGATNEAAHVQDVGAIWQIVDASAYGYSTSPVGPVSEGEFVVFRNTATNMYGAFRVDDIHGPSDFEAYVDITWYLQTDGSADFSSFANIFSDGFEDGDSGAWVLEPPTSGVLVEFLEALSTPRSGASLVNLLDPKLANDDEDPRGDS